MRSTIKKAILLYLAVSVLMFGSFGCEKGTGTDNQSTATKATAAKTSSANATAAKTTAASATAKPSSAQSEETSKTNTGTVSTDNSSDVADNVVVEENADGDVEDTDASENIGKTITETFAQGVDLGGITVSYGLWGAETLKMTDSPESTPLLTIVARRIKAAEEKYNFKFEFRQISEMSKYDEEVKKYAMAGLAYADILRMEVWNAFPVYPYNNFIIPLDDIIDFESPIMKANSYLNVGMWQDTHYGLTFQWMVAYPTVMYNQDIMDREGQPDILTLVENKQWTWDAFLSVAQACTRDIDGDGITDQWGILSPAIRIFAQKMLYSNETTGMKFVNGKATYSMDDPKALKALQFMADLVHVHKVFFGSTMLYRQGMGAMFVDNPFNNRTFLGLGLKSINVPFPMGPDASNYSNTTYQSFFDTISAFSARKEDIAKVWAEICLTWDENLNPIQELQDLIVAQNKEDWDWNPGNPLRQVASQREFEISYKPLWQLFKSDYFKGYPNMETRATDLIFNPISRGEKSVAQAVTSAKDELQAMMDEFN